MAENRTDIPSPNAPNFNQRIRETLQTYLGKQGNPLDRGLTLRDMIESGLVSLKGGYTLRPGGGGGALPLAPGPAAVVDAEPDLTPPPTPTGFTAAGAISHIFIEHDAPLYRQGHGHLRTRLYGKIVNAGDLLPTFSDAAEIAQFSGAVYAHSSNPATTWRLWIKWETVDGVLSVAPAGGINGVEAVTGQDVGALIEVLTGKITESQLYADLGSRINLIDGNDAGSVNARIQTEVADRTSVLLEEANARNSADAILAGAQNSIGTQVLGAAAALLAESGARTMAQSTIKAAMDATGLTLGVVAADVALEMERRMDGDSSLASSTTTLTASQASTAAALQVEQRVRASESEALAEQTTTLVAVTGANAAALSMEQQARADAEGSAASLTISLAASSGANAAAITQEQQVRSDESSAIADQISTLSVATDSSLAALQVEQQARADQTSALSQQTTTLSASTANAAAGLVVEQLARAEEGLAVASVVSGLSGAVGANTASLKVEQQTRVDESSSNATQMTTLSAATSGNAAALTVEQQARTDEKSATANQISSLASTVGDSASTLKVLERVQATAESTSSALTTTLSSAVGSNAAALQTELTTRAEADFASAAAVSTLAVTSGHNSAGIFSEQKVRAEESSSVASSIAGLAASVGINSAGILVEQTARSNAQTALAEQISTLSAATATNAAAITTEQQARADEAGALATQVNTIQASINSGIGESLYRNFSGGVEFWTHARLGNPESVDSANGVVLAADPDLGACGEFGNFTIVGSNVGPKDWLHVRPGRIYRLRAKFKVVTVATTGSMQFNAVIGCHTATRAMAGDGSAFSVNSTESITSPGVYEIESLFAHTGVAGSVAAFDAETALARPLLRAHSNPDGSVIRVQFVQLKDVTEELSLSAAIQTETTARVAEGIALANQVTTLQASAGAAPGLSRLRFWGFDAGLEGWDSTYASASNGVVTWTPTASNSTFIKSLSASDRYVGSQAPVIRARVRRVSGTGTWEGNLFHSTSAHGASISYRKTIPAPANPDAWNELEWDMSQLTEGATDYIDNEITALRIDLVSDANTSVWEFDWVAVGTRSVTQQDVALQTEATTRASETGDLFAQYTVKVDLAGHVSGYGLASTAKGATPTSQFGVRANQFFVAPPSVNQSAAPTTGLYKGYVWVDTSATPNVTKYYTGTEWSLSPQAIPFSVQASSTEINGVSVPAGVYMDTAFIRDGTITNAKIGDAAIDDAKISDLSASKITSGSISVGDYIQSTSYVAGTSGWRINGNGDADFGNATFRGTVKAGTTILGGAATSYSSGSGFYAGLDSTTYKWRVGSPTGARIQWNGSAVEVYNASNQLTISSGGISASYVSGLGTLATQNSVSTGQVTGLGTLATQNSVNWNSQITNVPEFGNFAYLSSITSANISTYIAGAAIGTAYIADAAITQAKIGNAAVGSAQIADAAITNAKIANAAIGSAQIADAAITNAKIGSAQVGTLQLASNAVTVSNSASGANPSTTLYVPANESLTVVAIAACKSATISSGGANYSDPYLTITIDGTVTSVYQGAGLLAGESGSTIFSPASSISARKVVSGGASGRTITISSSQTHSIDTTLVAFGNLR